MNHINSIHLHIYGCYTPIDENHRTSFWLEFLR
jgi:hypothetical protein